MPPWFVIANLGVAPSGVRQAATGSSAKRSLDAAVLNQV